MCKMHIGQCVYNTGECVYNADKSVCLQIGQCVQCL